MSPRLPSEVVDLIQLVLRSANLRRSAYDEVERDLTAHFEDGLSAGHSAAELIDRFGDPAEAGQQIARARRREGKGAPAMAGGGGGLTPDGILLREGRRAIRSLLGAPLFSLTVIATLALGVGANTAVFTVLDSVLIEPLPYPDADRLVRVYESSVEDGGREYLRGLAVLEYREWKDVFESFGVLYTYRENGADLTEGEAPERLVVSRVDAGFFDVMGAAPLLGRTFLPEESLSPGGQATEGTRNSDEIARVTVLSERLWQQRFAADPSIVGRPIRLDGVAFEVVGVLPAGFSMPFGTTPDLWVPIDLLPGGSNSWGNHYLSGVGKLREGVVPAAAQARAEVLTAAMIEQNPDADDWSVQLVPLRESLVGDSRRTMLLVLAGAVGLVLLSACVNVSNLVFARNLARTRELAVRSALGAGRPGLVLHLLSESVVLATVGAAAGVAVGWLGVRGLLALAPEALPTLLVPELSARVFVIGLAATTVALALFGLAPALRFSAAGPADAMRQGGRTGTDSRRAHGLRGGLVVVQVAAALVLVVGAGLLMRSFTALTQVELGAEPDGVLTFEVNLPVRRYADPMERQRLHETLGSRVATLPGVTAAGAASWLPLNGPYHTWGYSTEPGNLENDDAWSLADVRMVTGDYFDAVGIDVLAGERLDGIDLAGPELVWISRSLAERAFGDADPVGRIMYAANEPRRIAGIVEDVRYDPRQEVAPTLYVPHAHYADNRNWALVHAVRTTGNLGVLESRVREELAAIDPNLVMYRPRPLESFLAARRAQDRFGTALMGVFAALALALTAVGTYGVLANLVERKRREIGIRMALGARAESVRAMILRSALALCVVGSGLGVVAAWLGARSLRSLLFEVDPADPLVFAAAAAVLLGLSVLSAWLPARRATRMDPARTLGAE